jgi:hypothetical protein
MRVFRGADELVDAILALPVGAQVWAHGGGRYDTLWLLDRLALRGSIPDAQVFMSGASASSIRFKRGPILRDSSRLIPMTLSQAALLAGPAREKSPTGLDCICAHRCGGYCAMKVNMEPTAWASVEQYLVSDVELLRDVLEGLIRYCDESTIDLRGTLGGSAWATAQRWCSVPAASWDARVYDRVIEGYYGGRVEVGRVEAPTIERYDRRAAYPAGLLEPVPIGEPVQLDARRAALAWARARPGVYRATVRVPEQLAPPLPVRVRERIAYPYGTITGAWSHAELRYALEVAGCELVRWGGAIAWAEERADLAPYALEAFELRSRAPSAAHERWLKLLSNALPGKLGQGAEWPVVRLGDLSGDRAWSQVGRSPWVWSRVTWRIAESAHVHWASTITARARVELHEQIAHAGSSWCYSDTDSVVSTSALTRGLGEGLGEWSYDGPGTDWRARAPKCYAYESGDGERVAHAAGIPGALGGARWDQLAAGQPVTYDRGVESLIGAARRGGALFRRRANRYRLAPLGAWVGARRLDGVTTRAPSVRELANLP